MIGMAFSTSFGPLLANRFLLGLFEAGCLPLFTVIATSFYRKIECTWAIAMFYSQNGIGTHFEQGKAGETDSRFSIQQTSSEVFWPGLYRSRTAAISTSTKSSSSLSV